MEVPDIPVCTCQHGAHCLQHLDAAGGGVAPRNVTARLLGNIQVTQ